MIKPRVIRELLQPNQRINSDTFPRAYFVPEKHVTNQPAPKCRLCKTLCMQRLEMESKLTQLRRCKLIENIIWAGGFLLAIVLSQIASETTLKIYGAILFICVISSTLFVMSRKCPKCSKYFHGNTPLSGNTLRRSCAHCGLHISGKNA